MRGKKLLMGLLAGGLIFGGSALATDFSQYSTEELSKMRGTMREATQEEREAFRQEWQKRLKEMSPEERRQYVGPPVNAPRDGQGYKYRQSRKEGKGRGQEMGRGKGMGRGRGCRK